MNTFTNEFLKGQSKQSKKREREIKEKELPFQDINLTEQKRIRTGLRLEPKIEINLQVPEQQENISSELNINNIIKNFSFNPSRSNRYDWVRKQVVSELIFNSKSKIISRSLPQNWDKYNTNFKKLLNDETLPLNEQLKTNLSIFTKEEIPNEFKLEIYVIYEIYQFYNTIIVPTHALDEYYEKFERNHVDDSKTINSLFFYCGYIIINIKDLILYALDMIEYINSKKENSFHLPFMHRGYISLYNENNELNNLGHYIKLNSFDNKLLPSLQTNQAIYKNITLYLKKLEKKE